MKPLFYAQDSDLDEFMIAMGSPDWNYLSTTSSFFDSTEKIRIRARVIAIASADIEKLLDLRRVDPFRPEGYGDPNLRAACLYQVAKVVPTMDFIDLREKIKALGAENYSDSVFSAERIMDREIDPTAIALVQAYKRQYGLKSGVATEIVRG